MTHGDRRKGPDRRGLATNRRNRMTKIIAWCELRYLTLAELEALFRTLQIELGHAASVRPSAALCSPASKASAAPWRRALPGSRSRERGRFSLISGAERPVRSAARCFQAS